MSSAQEPSSFPRSVAIIGGAGFLGRHLVALLRRRHPGTSVAIADIAHQRPADLDPSVEWFGGVDITQPDSMMLALDGAGAVVHLAGLVSFWQSDRARLYQINKEGTRNVLLTCSWAKTKRLVHVSSAATIGFTNDPNTPVDESLAFDWSSVANKHYMCSKYAGELQLKDAARLNVSTVVANPASMYGPGDTRNTYRLFQAVQKGLVRAVPPGGNNVVDVRDVADGVCRMLWPHVPSERFLLGGYNLTFREINATIASVLGVRSSSRVIPAALRAPLVAAVRLAERFPSRPAVIAADDLDSGFYFRYYSSAKAKQHLDWTPRHTFEQTVRDSAADLAKHDLLSAYPGFRA
jgi:dihydroflavonol-4-reductase